MAQKERYAIYLADENLNGITSFPDLLYLEMTWTCNEVGGFTMRLPDKYCKLFIDLGILDNGKKCMPKYWLLPYRIAGGTCELWEKQAWLIQKPLMVQRNDGSCYLQIEASSATELLNYRSIFAPRDEDGDGNNQNPYTNHAGPVDEVMCKIFEQQFGDQQNLDAAKAPANRDWITAGCVAKGDVKDENGNVIPLDAQGQPIAPATWCGPQWDPQLDYRGTLLDIFTEGAAASATEGQPFFFEMQPTCTPGPYGEQAGLPMLLQICCGHRGKDRTFGNAAGNQPVLLSDANGALAAFTLGPDYTNDYSVAMTVGLDEDGNELTSIICDDDKATCTKWGWKEAIQVDQDAQTQEIVNTANAAFLADGVQSGEVIAEFANTRGVCYGQHFGGGDCVVLEQKKQRRNVRVKSVNVKCEDKQIKYRLKFEAV